MHNNFHQHGHNYKSKKEGKDVKNMDKKIFTILCSKDHLSGPVRENHKTKQKTFIKLLSLIKKSNQYF